MKASVLALKQPGNHGPHAGSICQKICPQRPQPGKYDYFAQPESYSRSGAWEFFTENSLASASRTAHLRSPQALGLDLAARSRDAPTPFIGFPSTSPLLRPRSHESQRLESFTYSA